MNNKNRILDDMARLISDAVGVAQHVRQEFDTVLKNKAEQFVNHLDLVPREQFEIVREMAEKARLENEQLATKLHEIELKFEQLLHENKKKKSKG